jgi:hypothetical protein
VDKPLLKSALSKIWSLVYRSTQATLTPEQEEELVSAINTVSGNWDEKDVFIGRANFVCDCARMHLSALKAIPPRKPTGWNAVMEDCQFLERYLQQDSS